MLGMLLDALTLCIGVGCLVAWAAMAWAAFDLLLNWND